MKKLVLRRGRLHLSIGKPDNPNTHFLGIWAGREKIAWVFVIWLWWIAFMVAYKRLIKEAINE